MKDKETETLPKWALGAALELFPRGAPNTHYAYTTDEQNERAKQAFRDEMAKVIAKHRPATMEDRACGWVYDADHDYYTTECGEDIAFPEMDRKPPIGREWLKFCSGCGKKALLREAGRVK